MDASTIQLIKDGGLLVFSLLALGALLRGWVAPKPVVDDKDKTIAYEREQKHEAQAHAKAAMASHDRLADAVEARNRLDEARVEASKSRRAG